MPSVDIVIVNWNAGERLSDCLASIKRFGSEQTSNVIVVDNASTDNSLDGIESFGLPTTVIRNTENLGFAKACNQGAAIGRAPYILFLNPDARLYKDSLLAPLAYMEQKKNDDVGVCGIQLIDLNNRVSRTCAHFPTLARWGMQAIGINRLPGFKSSGVHMSGWDHMSTTDVDHVIGAFYFVRRRSFEQLQGFDERFFVYLEDLDLSYRLSMAGWRSVYLANVNAFHEGGGTSQQVKATRLFYSLRSRVIYGFKHFSAWQAWLLVLVTLLIEPVTRVFFCLLQGNWRGVIDTVRGFRMLWGSLPDMLSTGRGVYQ